MRQPSSAGRGRRSGLGLSRFMDAARRWDVDAVRDALRQQPELATTVDTRGRTALHVCAASPVSAGRRPPSAAVATARLLLGAGAAIDAVHDIADREAQFRATPLWHAIARGRNKPLARFLLRSGANPDWCFWSVIWNDDESMARALHAAGANLDLTVRGETPLLYATRLRRTRMVKWLLKHGANPNIGDDRGGTPLLYAVRRQSLAEVEALLRHGADPTLTSADGVSPLALVARGRASRIRTLIERSTPARGG